MVVCVSAKQIVALVKRLPEVGEPALDDFANKLAISDVGDVVPETERFLRPWKSDTDKSVQKLIEAAIAIAKACK